MKKWQLWATVIGLGIGVAYLGCELWKAASANRDLANDNFEQRQQKENAIQQANIEKQQKDLALQKNVELKNEMTQLKNKVDQQKLDQA